MSDLPSESWVTWQPEESPRPYGSWFQVTTDTDVVGLRFQARDVMDFVIGAKRADGDQMPWYVDLIREPDNDQDGRAIKVVGAWIDQRSNKSRMVHLGYVAAETAFHIARAGPDLPLAAALHQIALAQHKGAGFGVRITIDILTPPPSHLRWGDAVRLLRPADEPAERE